MLHLDDHLFDLIIKSQQFRSFDISLYALKHLIFLSPIVNIFDEYFKRNNINFKFTITLNKYIPKKEFSNYSDLIQEKVNTGYLRKAELNILNNIQNQFNSSQNKINCSLIDLPELINKNSLITHTNNRITDISVLFTGDKNSLSKFINNYLDCYEKDLLKIPILFNFRKFKIQYEIVLDILNSFYKDSANNFDMILSEMDFIKFIKKTWNYYEYKESEKIAPQYLYTPFTTLYYLNSKKLIDIYNLTLTKHQNNRFEIFAKVQLANSINKIKLSLIEFRANKDFSVIWLYGKEFHLASSEKVQYILKEMFELYLNNGQEIVSKSDFDKLSNRINVKFDYPISKNFKSYKNDSSLKYLYDNLVQLVNKRKGLYKLKINVHKSELI